MRYDIVRQKRRYEMFEKKNAKEVLDIINFFGRYQLRHDDIVKKQYIYYDTDNLDLFKSGIALYRTIINGKHTLTMTLERLYNENNKFLQSYSNKRNEIPLEPSNSIFDFPEFLRNSFKNMFDGFLNFDPDYLLKKLKITYSISTISNEYRISNGSGLKLTLTFDSDTYLNHWTKKKSLGYFCTVYQHSREDTDTEFDNLTSKLERYCRSLTRIKDSKITVAREKTKTIVKEDTKSKKKKQVSKK